MTAITEPQLDINTKEITCSHGCTVSNVDKEQLYFLYVAYLIMGLLKPLVGFSKLLY